MLASKCVTQGPAIPCDTTTYNETEASSTHTHTYTYVHPWDLIKATDRNSVTNYTHTHGVSNATVHTSDQSSSQTANTFRILHPETSKWQTRCIATIITRSYTHTHIRGWLTHTHTCVRVCAQLQNFNSPCALHAIQFECGARK